MENNNIELPFTVKEEMEPILDMGYIQSSQALILDNKYSDTLFLKGIEGYSSIQQNEDNDSETYHSGEDINYKVESLPHEAENPKYILTHYDQPNYFRLIKSTSDSCLYNKIACIEQDNYCATVGLLNTSTSTFISDNLYNKQWNVAKQRELPKLDTFKSDRFDEKSLDEQNSQGKLLQLEENNYEQNSDDKAVCKIVSSHQKLNDESNEIALLEKDEEETYLDDYNNNEDEERLRSNSVPLSDLSSFDSQKLDDENLNAKSPDKTKDKNDPAYIPRKGWFFQHDTRDEGDFNENDNNNRQTVEKPDTSNQSVNHLEEQGNIVSKEGGLKTKLDGRWTHDLFDEYEQSPKTPEEILLEYGESRDELMMNNGSDNRRSRKFRRNTPKYNRNWQDSEAYQRKKYQPHELMPRPGTKVQADTMSIRRRSDESNTNSKYSPTQRPSVTGRRSEEVSARNKIGQSNQRTFIERGQHENNSNHKKMVLAGANIEKFGRSNQTYKNEGDYYNYDDLNRSRDDRKTLGARTKPAFNIDKMADVKIGGKANGERVTKRYSQTRPPFVQEQPETGSRYNGSETKNNYDGEQRSHRNAINLEKSNNKNYDGERFHRNAINLEKNNKENIDTSKRADASQQTCFRGGDRFQRDRAFPREICPNLPYQPTRKPLNQNRHDDYSRSRYDGDFYKKDSNRNNYDPPAAAAAANPHQKPLQSHHHARDGNNLTKAYTKSRNAIQVKSTRDYPQNEIQHGTRSRHESSHARNDDHKPEIKRADHDLISKVVKQQPSNEPLGKGLPQPIPSQQQQQQQHHQIHSTEMAPSVNLFQPNPYLMAQNQRMMIPHAQQLMLMQRAANFNNFQQHPLFQQPLHAVSPNMSDLNIDQNSIAFMNSPLENDHIPALCSPYNSLLSNQQNLMLANPYLTHFNHSNLGLLGSGHQIKGGLSNSSKVATTSLLKEHDSTNLLSSTTIPFQTEEEIAANSPHLQYTDGNSFNNGNLSDMLAAQHQSFPYPFYPHIPFFHPTSQLNPPINFFPDPAAMYDNAVSSASAYPQSGTTFFGNQSAPNSLYKYEPMSSGISLDQQHLHHAHKGAYEKGKGLAINPNLLGDEAASIVSDSHLSKGEYGSTYQYGMAFFNSNASKTVPKEQRNVMLEDK